MSSINILIDSWSSQVLFQQAPPIDPSTNEPIYPPVAQYNHPTVTGQRLNTILGAMTSYGLSTNNPWNITFTSPPITADQLENINVYVSFTHYINIPGSQSSGGFAYQDSELDLLQSFVSNGGSILLMTDHGQTNSIPDWTANDAPLAAMFGITLENYFVTSPAGDPEYMIMTVNPDLSFIANQVAGISAHDSCIIVPPDTFTSIAQFPSNAVAYDYAGGSSNPITPPQPYFSILVPYGNNGGQVIVTGNSGSFGDYGSPNPAPGLVTMENNLMFFLNCVAYLGGLTCVPKPGQGPC